MNKSHTFKTAFEFKVIDSPEETKLDFYCFPGALKGGWVVGAAVEFTQFGWCGSFANGGISPKGITGVYSFPDENKLLIIAKGKGYLVNPSEPEATLELKELPIIGVFSSSKYSLIIIHDFVRFTAYGLNGVEWKTPPMSYDGIKIQTITDDVISGSAWSAPENKWLDFKLQMQTGAYEGGAR